MFHEIANHLARWELLDTSIVLTAALLGMACALPGNFLLLRRQSMMGDALSHTTLPGIVLAFLLAHWLDDQGYISPQTYHAVWLTALFIGAIVLGVLTALLSELVRSLGRVESSAALGVVFTSLFALGLLLIRLYTSQVHLDPDCVLYGVLESAARPRGSQLPPVVYTSGGILAVNFLLMTLFFKELRISTFDPQLATVQGISARVVHLGLMVITAATLVVAFKSVGSIVVIAMLIVPAATARLLCDRLWPTILVSLLVACCSALIGHAMAMVLPRMIFSRLGYAGVGAGGTAGLIAVASGGLLTLAMVFAPRQGLLSKLAARAWLGIKIAGEDWLGVLYRQEELPLPQRKNVTAALVAESNNLSTLVSYLAVLRLRWQGKVLAAADAYQLTPMGREEGRHLIRAHRLWETYLARHFPETAAHLHASAHVAEHYLSPGMKEQLSAELDRPQQDPQGKAIPQ